MVKYPFTQRRSSKLRDFIIGFLPNYDSDKVYDSDVKKLSMANILHKSGLIVFDEKVIKIR